MRKLKISLYKRRSHIFPHVVRLAGGLIEIVCHFFMKWNKICFFTCQWKNPLLLTRFENLHIDGPHIVNIRMLILP